MKNWHKNSPKILAQNNDQTPKFIGQKNIAVGVCQACRSTRAVDRQRSEIRPLGLRSTGPVDRASGTESSLSVGRPIRSTGFFPESRSSLAVDRPSSAQRRARLCTSVDRVGRPTSSCGRPSSRPAEAKQKS